jgi:hypothetical protein
VVVAGGHDGAISLNDDHHNDHRLGCGWGALPFAGQQQSAQDGIEEDVYSLDSLSEPTSPTADQANVHTQPTSPLELKIQFCVHSSRMVVFNSGVGADSMEQQSAIPLRNDFIQSFQVVENPAARLRFGHHGELVDFPSKCISRAHDDVGCWFREPENQSFPRNAWKTAVAPRATESESKPVLGTPKET